MSAILEIKNLSLSLFGQQILRELTLSIAEGEFVILVGANGCGKSSLIKMINGLLQPSSGSVFINNKNLKGIPVYEVAKKVSTLTQDLNHSTFGELSVYTNMILAQSRSSISLNKDQIANYLGTFNKSLCERMDVETKSLSGGQRQALALAMCFAHRPKILLLDEHTSALDPKAAEYLMERTFEHVSNEKLTTLMITHSLDHALRFGTRLIAMKEGSIVLDIKNGEKASLTKSSLINLAYA